MITSQVEETKRNISGIKLSSAYYVILFLFFIFFSQALFPSHIMVSFIAFGLAIVVLLVVLFTAGRNEMFTFLYVTVAMGIVIPFAQQRELKLIIPTLFLAVSIFRFYPRIIRIKRQYSHPVVFCMILFILCCLISIFNGIKIPGINSPSNFNSGLLNRFNMLNSIIVFLTAMILFDYNEIIGWTQSFFKFYMAVLLVSIVIVLFNIGPFPFFNTFSWSILIENEGSRKMIIAGISASFVLIYTLVFVKDKLAFYILIPLSLFGLLISGSRVSFVAGFLMIFISFMIRRQVLGKSLVMLGICIVAICYILLSPIILLVPEKYQRLVILFPAQYYTGSMAHLAESAAAASTSFRMDILSLAVVEIPKHPFIGNGFGIPMGQYDFSSNFLEHFHNMPQELLYHDFMITGNLHNTFFGITYLFGFPALFLFTYVLSKLLWRHYKVSGKLTGEKRQVAIFLTIVFCNYFLFALVTDLIFDLQFFILIAIGIKTLLFYYNDGPLLRETGVGENPA